MKNRLSFQIVLVLVTVVVGVLLLKNKNPSAPANNQISFENSNVGEKTIQEKEVVVGNQTRGSTQEIKSVDVKKCASFVTTTSNLDLVLKEITSNISFQPSLEMNEYQLTGPNAEEIVIQEMPHEVPKDQIRVFKMAADGLPDRVKDFPNAGSSLNGKLDGALSLGKLNKKIEKYQALNKEGQQLNYEIEQGRVARISFVKGKSQLLCEEGSCSCNEF